jgi:uncharacterized protein YcbK (DUF882 family)
MGRRTFLAFGIGAAATTLLADPVDAAVHVASPERKIALYNTHTGEHLKAVYWERGRYLPDSLHAANHLLRDFRSGKVHAIDPKALDLVAAIHRKLGASGPVHIISGYRSPETNAWLAAVSDGVAGHSLHMQGQAIDIRIPGHSVHQISRAAMSLRAGGVGTYPESDFVHVDTGRIRYW